MKKEKQRIAIAESQGWEWCYHTDLHNTKCWGWEQKGVSRHETDYYKCEKSNYLHELPDYLNDLNACHEFEKTLFPDDAQYSQWNFYSLHLGELTNNDNGRGWKPLSNADCFRIANATAAQRCEAFLKTLDLWEDAE